MWICYKERKERMDHKIQSMCIEAHVSFIHICIHAYAHFWSRCIHTVQQVRKLQCRSFILCKIYSTSRIHKYLYFVLFYHCQSPLLGCALM